MSEVTLQTEKKEGFLFKIKKSFVNFGKGCKDFFVNAGKGIKNFFKDPKTGFKNIWKWMKKQNIRFWRRHQMISWLNMFRFCGKMVLHLMQSKNIA